MYRLFTEKLLLILRMYAYKIVYIAKNIINKVFICQYKYIISINSLVRLFRRVFIQIEVNQ